MRRPPFTGPNIFALINSHLSEQPPLVSKLQPGLPASVDRVLGKAMDKAPARRYATCAQFAADLGRALGLVPGPLEADSGQRPGRGRDRGPAKPHQATELAGPAVAAAAAGAGAAGGLVSPVPRRKRREPLVGPRRQALARCPRAAGHRR